MTSSLERLVLNGLDLTSGNFGLEAVDLTPPKKRPEYAQGADSDGALLVRTPRYENRTIGATIRVQTQASMDNALARIGELADALQEAEQNPEGVPLEWTPANSTKTITFYVLSGEVTGLPTVVEGSDAGYFALTPKVTIAMTAKPFGYGAEVEAAAAKANETGLSTVILTVPSVAGDVPAEGRLVIKDTAAVGRRYVEWGLQQRYYDAATALILDNESMTPVGGAQSEAANTGAYKPGGAKGTIATTLLPEPTVCANTGNLKHIGTFRVKARVQVVLGSESLAENVHVRLSYQDGEGPLRANPWQTLSLGGKFVEVDLGEITLTEAVKGTQKWLGQIEAYSENTAAKDVFHIDYLTFVPAGEGYGKARGVQSSAPGTIVAYDAFTTGTLSGSLNTRTPPVGAAWATSGVATDYTVATGNVSRVTNVNEAKPRFAVLGSNATNSSVRVLGEMGAAGTGQFFDYIILRWVNEENYAYLRLNRAGPVEIIEYELSVVVAGVKTALAFGSTGLPSAAVAYTATVTALTDGSLAAELTLSAGGWSNLKVSGSSSALATGGALATGKVGVADRCARSAGAAVTRKVLSIAGISVPAIPYCIQPSRTMEVQSDCALTTDSAGTTYGPVQLYRGSRFYVPQDGQANRTSRILVKADRNDLEESDQQTIADAFTAQVFVTPRYHVVPR